MLFFRVHMIEFKKICLMGLWMLLYFCSYGQTQNTYSEGDSAANMEEEISEPPREISKEHWDKILQDKDFIYNHHKKKPEKQASTGIDVSGFFGSALLKWIFIGLACLIVGIIGFSLFNNTEYNYFRKYRNGNEELAPMEQIEKYTAWETALKEALSIPDYRLAYRVLYLEVLQMLHQKNKIQYAEEKTNWDYVRSLSGTSIYETFRSFTHHFDYIWYGEFQPDQQTYKKLEDQLTLFKQDIASS